MHMHRPTHKHAHIHTHKHTRNLKQEPEPEEAEEEEATIEDVQSDLRVLHRLLVLVCRKAGVTEAEIKAANNGTNPGPDSE